MVGESAALDILLNAVLDCLLPGSVEMVEVCRESLGRLGVSGRGFGMMDIIASAAADDEVEAWVGLGGLRGWGPAGRVTDQTVCVLGKQALL